ncbi:GntR family transcriptional regulator [Planctomicrobium sp. SH664]|uniref:GntR family transcriptional regulator n=1 Tax=Planctomicrobium sp. SH664 TaxID=3448125 RepID=UPI003F5B08CE
MSVGSSRSARHSLRLVTEPAVTKARAVFLSLRSQILSGELAPNYRLTLRPIASQFGTGINAVSEAVKALAAEGLVALEGQAGARVIARDLSRIRGEYIYRIAIECEIARRFAEIASDVQVNLLDLISCKIDRMVANGESLEECRQLDVHFHKTLAEFTGIPPLTDALVPLLDRLVMLDPTENQRVEIPGHSHKELMEAIRLRAPEDAAYRMREHIDHCMQLSLAVLYV